MRRLYCVCWAVALAACGADPEAPPAGLDVAPPADVVEDAGEPVADLVAPDPGPDLPPPPDVAPDPPDDGPAPDTAGADDGDAAPPDAGPAPPRLVLGQLSGDEISELFTDQPVEIVQGPQGGIHAEVAVELQDATLTTEGALVVELQCATYVDGTLVGLIQVDQYKLLPVTAGHYRSPVIPVFFAEDQAEVYEGLTADLGCRVEHGNSSLEVSRLVVLVDDV